VLPAQHAQQVNDDQQAEVQAPLQRAADTSQSTPNAAGEKEGADHASDKERPRADRHIERLSLAKDPFAPGPNGG